MRARLNYVGMVLAMAASAAAVQASAVTPGHLVILQSSGDADVAARTAVPVSLVEFTTAPNSAVVQSLDVPTSGDARLTIGAQTTTEGVLTLNDGYIGIAGYDSDVGTALVFNGTTNAVRRMIAYDASKDLAGGPQYNATTTIFNNGNFRSVLYSATAGGAYGIGALAGVVFQPNGGSGTGTNVWTGGPPNPAAQQGIGVFNGNLYTYQSTGTHAIQKFTGLPTTEGNAPTTFIATPQSSNNGTGITGFNFWVSPDESTVYLAEDTDTASAANGGQPTGGIKKYVKGGDGTYSLAYTISTDYDGAGGALTGVRSISVDNSRAVPVIYATTADQQKVIVLSDPGTAEGAAATVSVLQTASADAAIRSVLYVPHVAGDADDNWLVNADDYTLIDRGRGRYVGGQIAVGQAAWRDGDFNYDGAVDGADYLIIDAKFAASHPLSAELLASREAEFGGDYVASLAAAVPEPTMLSLGAVAVCAISSRRRRRLAK